MKSEILLTLIKEVVKNEVKQQVKEELTKLIKSGVVTLNKERKQPSLMEMTEVNSTTPFKKQTVVATQQKPQPIKEYTKNPMLNEVLNMTTPFTAQQRAEGGVPGMTGGSILDAIQPQTYEENNWETMDYRTANIPDQTIQTTDNAGVDALTKALSRDYRELVKRFK